MPMASVMGPFIEYSDYIDYMRQSRDFKNPPISIPKACIAALSAIICMGLTQFIPTVADYNSFVTDEWAQKPIWR